MVGFPRKNFRNRGYIILHWPSKCQENHESNGKKSRGVKNPEEWVAGLGLPLVERTKPPEPPGCLIFGGFTDSPHLLTNKKLGVWAQYRLHLSFLGGYFSSFENILRQREICTKNPEIIENCPHQDTFNKGCINVHCS